MSGFNLDIEHPRLCPFSKTVDRTDWKLAGSGYPIVYSEVEHFNICIGEKCMMYLYDRFSDTEQCLLGREPHYT